MKRCLTIAWLLAGCLAAAPLLHAQTPPGAAGQNQPAAKTPAQPPAAPQSGANPFPTDTTEVPVLRPTNTPDSDAGGNADSTGRLPLPSQDLDPAQSPDDATAEAAGSPASDFSSSSAGLSGILPPADDAQPGKGKRGKAAMPEPVHVETATEDITVGKYYLDNKDWRAALSRFQSAMVLDPDEPEVYWGLAESERHLGDFSSARAYYEKVALYDPDSRHGKDAIKALREPEIANAKAAAPAPPAAAPQK
jgi:hypothetical protein